MTAAMQKALELHKAHSVSTRFPTASEQESIRHLNKHRTSLLSDDWPKKVAAFHSLTNIIPPELWGTSHAELRLRKSLLREELFDECFFHIDRLISGEHVSVEDEFIEVVDGALDTIYVLLGLLLNLGLPTQLINLLMQEVHASNMTKVLDDGTPLINVLTPDGLVDPAKPENKVLKTANYISPDLRTVIREWFADNRAKQTSA
jgi:Uncharacterized protein conserved in bacteria